MTNRKIEVEKLPDGCRGHFIFGHSGCTYAFKDLNPNNPGVYCKWDETRENLIMFAGERPNNCPLVQMENPNNDLAKRGDCEKI